MKNLLKSVFGDQMRRTYEHVGENQEISTRLPSENWTVILGVL